LAIVLPIITSPISFSDVAAHVYCRISLLAAYRGFLLPCVFALLASIFLKHWMRGWEHVGKWKIILLAGKLVLVCRKDCSSVYWSCENIRMFAVEIQVLSLYIRRSF
jgi:hypothetical protein